MGKVDRIQERREWGMGQGVSESVWGCPTEQPIQPDV